MAKIKRSRADEGIFLILVLLWPIGLVVVLGIELPDIIYDWSIKRGNNE